MENQHENQPPTKVSSTWFFERTGDKYIFACDEQEAWNLLNNKSNWARRDFKMLGMSDGKTYISMLKSANQNALELKQKRDTLALDFDRYSKTEERLRFVELKDDTDEMVVKVKGILSNLSKEIQELDDKLSNHNRDTVKKAFEAELNKARGNMVMPQNFDVMTPVSADREKILSNIKR
jgi:hypothetical protein